MNITHLYRSSRAAFGAIGVGAGMHGDVSG
jgi:hypothetical protein